MKKLLITIILLFGFIYYRNAFSELKSVVPQNVLGSISLMTLGTDNRIG